MLALEFFWKWWYRIFFLSIVLYLGMYVLRNGDEPFLDRTILAYNLFSTMLYFLSIPFFMRIRFKYLEAGIITSQLTVGLLLFAFLKLIYFLDHSNFFEFISIDSALYDSIAEQFRFQDLPLTAENLGKFGLNSGDYGAPVLTYFAYLFYPSPLLFGLFNIAYTTITCLFLVRTTRDFLSSEYLKLMALTWGLSQFMIYHNSTNLKESFMIMLVMMSFWAFKKVLHKDYLVGLPMLIVSVFLMYFFRTPLVAMVLVAFAISYVLFYVKGATRWALLLPMGAAFAYLLIIMLPLLGRFLINYSLILGYRNLGDQGAIAYFVMILSGLVGPLPTFFQQDEIKVSLYASSLLIRVVLSVFTFVAFFNLKKVKERTQKALIYAIISFLLFEILALVYLLDSLELRKSLPHFQFVYFLVFFGMFHTEKIEGKLKWRFNIAIVGLVFLVLVWNILRI